MAGMQRGGVTLLLTVLLAAGCSSDGDTPRPPGLIEAWSVSSITPIGQPVAVGDMAVVYGTANRHLFLYGVAVGDGTVRWRQPASPSALLPGVSLTPSVVDGLVAYLRPDPEANLLARLVVAAPDTGSDRLVSDAMILRSEPGPCPDGGKDVCIRAIDDDGRSVSRRFSVGAGGPVPDRAAAPAGSRWVGEGLLDLGRRDPEDLAGFQDGAVRWRSSLADHFGVDFSTDYGWHFALYKSAGLHIGSVGHPPVREDPTVAVTDLTRAGTAAVSAATGSSAWRSDGTDFGCEARIFLGRPGADDHFEPWPVRCRYRGMVRYDRATDVPTYQDLDVTVEGFDVPTGRTTWSVPLGPAEAFLDEAADPTPVNDSEVLVQGSSGPVIIDLGTGVTRPPAKGEAFWCVTNVRFDYHETMHFAGGKTSNEWRGGTRLDPCAPDRSLSSAVPAHLDKRLGATVGERTVVATGRGLVAYDRARGNA